MCKYEAPAPTVLPSNCRLVKTDCRHSFQRLARWRRASCDTAVNPAHPQLGRRRITKRGSLAVLKFPTAWYLLPLYGGLQKKSQQRRRMPARIKENEKCSCFDVSYSSRSNQHLRAFKAVCSCLGNFQNTEKAGLNSRV